MKKISFIIGFMTMLTFTLIGQTKFAKISCHKCETFKQGCGTCKDNATGEVFTGLIVNGTQKIYQGAKVEIKGPNLVGLTDAFGNTADLDATRLSATDANGNVIVIRNRTQLLDYLSECNCTAGDAGEPGPPGADGADGMDGEQGIQGEQGEQGIQGIQGIPGVAGADGADGTNGTNGTNGVDGADGEDGANCWDAVGDANGDGNIDADDCLVDVEHPGTYVEDGIFTQVDSAIHSDGSSNYAVNIDSVALKAFIGRALAACLTHDTGENTHIDSDGNTVITDNDTFAWEGVPFLFDSSSHVFVCDDGETGPTPEARVFATPPDPATGESTVTFEFLDCEGNPIPSGQCEPARLVWNLTTAGVPMYTELVGDLCTDLSQWTVTSGFDVTPFVSGVPSNTTSVAINKGFWSFTEGYRYSATSGSQLNGNQYVSALAPLDARTEATDIELEIYVTNPSSPTGCTDESVNVDNVDTICRLLDRWGIGLSKNSQFGSAPGFVGTDNFRTFLNFNGFNPDNLMNQSLVTMERSNGDHIPPPGNYTSLANEERFFQDWTLNVADDISNFRGTSTKLNGLFAEMNDVWQHAPISATYRAVMLNTGASSNQYGDCQLDFTTTFTLQSLDTDELVFVSATYTITDPNGSVANSGNLVVPTWSNNTASSATNVTVVDAIPGIYILEHQLTMTHPDGVTRTATHYAQHEVNYSY